MQSQSSMFQACFVYTDEILSDFEKLYHLKGSLSPVARIICGVLGVAGAIYFGFQLYRHGFQIATAGYLIVCSLMILVAVSSRRRSGADDTLKKYRKYYENHRATFRIDADGVDMKLEGQKTTPTASSARSTVCLKRNAVSTSSSRARPTTFFPKRPCPRRTQTLCAPICSSSAKRSSNSMPCKPHASWIAW